MKKVLLPVLVLIIILAVVSCSVRTEREDTSLFETKEVATTEIIEQTTEIITETTETATISETITGTQTQKQTETTLHTTTKETTIKETTAKETTQPSTTEVTVPPIIITTTAPKIEPYYDMKAAEEILRRTNIERLKRFLPPLTLSESLCDAAKIRSYEISISFSHTRPDGSSCNTVYTQDIGENIAYGQQTYDEVFSAWMNSEGHKKNILKEDYTGMGVCCYVDENGIRHWAQLFII